jgi:hypothetical protein
MIEPNVIKVPEITPELIAENERQQQEWRERFSYEAPSRETHADRVIADNLRILDHMYHALRRSSGDARDEIRARIAAMSQRYGYLGGESRPFRPGGTLDQRPEQRRLYRSYIEAVKRPDDQWCEHPLFEHVDGQLQQVATREFDFPSEHHAGTVSMLRCRHCGFRNAKLPAAQGAGKAVGASTCRTCRAEAGRRDREGGDIVRIDRTGCTRIVIVTRRYAVKVPNFLGPGPRGWRWRSFLLGLLANLQESRFAATGWPELCPIVFRLPLGFLNVMPRVEILSDEEFLAFDAVAFCDKTDYVVPAEHKSNSFGKWNGRIVAIDYGN